MNRRCELLDDPSVKLTVDGCLPWVVANAGAHGYYRTSYPEPMLRALIAAGNLKPAGAITLLSDEGALVRAGRHGVGRFLDVAATLARQMDSAAVVESAGARLRYVHEYLTTTTSAGAYEAWVRGQLSDALEGLPPPAARPSADQSLRKAALMATLGVAGNSFDVMRAARRAVDEYLRGPSAAIDPTLLDTLVELAAINGDRELYEHFLKRSRAADAPEERYRFLYALADFRDSGLLKRTMELALSDEVRSQDRGGLIAAVLANPAGRARAWSKVQLRWQDLEKSLSAFGGVSRIIGALGAFCDPGHLADVERFFSAHPVPSAERTLRQSVERIEGCIALREAQRPQLEQWLTTTAAHR